MLLNYALHIQICVSPHQVNHYVRTFDAMFRNCMYGFVCQCEPISNSFIQSLQRYNKYSCFLQYLTLLYDGDQLQWLIVHCIGVCFLQHCLNLPCVLCCLMIFVFTKIWHAKTFETLIKTICMLLRASPFDSFRHLLHNLMLKCLQFSLHCWITIWWVNAFTAAVMFQCLASPCVVCACRLTLALHCTMTNHFCVTGLFKCV